MIDPLSLHLIWVLRCSTRQLRKFQAHFSPSRGAGCSQEDVFGALRPTQESATRPGRGTNVSGGHILGSISLCARAGNDTKCGIT